MAALRKVLGGPPKPPQKDESRLRWLISYSDFMMQLVCLFILLFSVSTLQRDKLAAAAAHYRASVGLENPVDSLEDADAPALGKESLVSGRPGGADLPRVRYRMREVREGWRIEFTQPLFPPGSARLDAEACATLDEVAREARRYVGMTGVTGVVGGPSDLPLDGDVAALSHARAEAISAHLVREGFESALDPRFLTVGGRVARSVEIEGRAEIVLRIR